MQVAKCSLLQEKEYAEQMTGDTARLSVQLVQANKEPHWEHRKGLCVSGNKVTFAERCRLVLR